MITRKSGRGLKWAKFDNVIWLVRLILVQYVLFLSVFISVAYDMEYILLKWLVGFLSRKTGDLIMKDFSTMLISTRIFVAVEIIRTLKDSEFFISRSIYKPALLMSISG